MKRSRKEFFPRLIFGLFFVYILLLACFNILIVLNKNTIESFLADLLEAEKVSIGNVSNLPLVFISGTDFEIVVDEEISLRVEGIYVHYRILKLFTKEFEKMIKEIHIENVIARGHNIGLKDYQDVLQKKFAQKDSVTTPVNTEELLEQLQFEVKIKNISVVLNVMKQFWYTLDVRGMNLGMRDSAVSWKALINVNARWSNMLLLADGQFTTEGSLNDFKSLDGFAGVNIKHLNLIGIPTIRSNLVVNSIFTEGKPTVTMNDVYNTNNIILKNEEEFFFSLQRTFTIKYGDFEESTLLDYVFKPGTWIFDLSIERKADWRLNLEFKSPQHPDYGVDIFISSIRKDKLYSAIIDFRSHFFGAIKGDLLIPIRKGLYPLPSGSAYLTDVRFILNGLIFSGNVIIDSVPNKNEMDLTGFDVRMNGGLIGDTSVKFEFTPEGVFNIYPRYLMGAAVEVSASIGKKITVELKALDVDGDFVAQNIKIPIFGIKDSRYRGEISMFKKDRNSPFFLNGYLKGFLDEVEQIDAIISLEDEKIDIPRFHIISPDILLDGTVLIESKMSNTLVTIDANGSFKSNDIIPIKVGVDIQKHYVTVSGLVDEQVQINTLTEGFNTDFTVLFDKYPLKKLGVNGVLDAYLVMAFDAVSITRFSIQEVVWDINNRKVKMDFDTLQNTNTGLLDTTYLKIGLDNDDLDAYGHFSFLNSGFSGAFRFDRGGSFQFNFGRYVVKYQIDIKDLVVDNILNFDIFEPASFLKTEETEVVLVDFNVNVEGIWSDLLYKGSLKMEGRDDDKFRFTVPEFVVSNTGLSLTNLRLRHSRMNLDSDISLINTNDNLSTLLSGAVTFDDILKTDFKFDYTLKSNQGLLKYKIPNLYFLSKKPMTITGQVIHDAEQYLFVSDSIKNGVVGSFFNGDNNQKWDISFMSDSMRFVSEGVLSEEDIQAALNWDIFLKKLSLSGDVRKLRGELALNTTVEGKLDNPIVNGELVGQDIMISLKSLRNKLEMSGKQAIYISNNQITIPEVIIKAGNGGEFGLEGSASVQNQTIGATDIRFYSKNNTANKGGSFLNWDLDIPYLVVKGRTYIKDINLTGAIDDLVLAADISTENLNIGLELNDAIGLTGTAQENNPLLALTSLLELDINIDMRNKSRFLNQLFDLEFEQQNPISIQGNIGDGTVVFTGDFNIEKGKVSYLNTDLKVSTGVMQFSGDQGDPFPYISLNTETPRNSQNELVDIYVSFEGKLPEFELSQISSAPTKSRSELLNLIGFGAVADNSRTSSSQSSAQDLLASGVGVAENAFFTAPLARRIQKLIPVDTLQIKTDVLGNLTRSVMNDSSRNAVTGLSILHGSELEVGQYFPGIAGLQVKYNLRLESPDNSSLDSGSLNQIHKVGAEYSRLLPYNWQGGVGLNALIEVTPSAQTAPELEGILDISVKKRF